MMPSHLEHGERGEGGSAKYASHRYSKEVTKTTTRVPGEIHSDAVG